MGLQVPKHDIAVLFIASVVIKVSPLLDYICVYISSSFNIESEN